MLVSEHLDRLEADGPRLAAAAERAGLDADVPPCPGWSVRDLVVHTGGVLRWANSVVAGRLDHDPAPGTDDLQRPGGGTDVLAWFLAGHADLVATLRAAGSDLDCYTFLPAPSPLTFWSRRQASEVAIHLADAQAAVGGVSPVDGAFALDGIEEMLTGFAAFRRSRASAVLAVRPEGVDPWRVELGSERIVATRADGPADATVAGSPSDVYLWLWNRPSAAVVSGDAEVAAAWRKVRVRWS